MADHLRDDMGGGAKPVDADQPRIAGHTQGAVADQPGAHQRRGLDIAVDRVDRKAIPLIGDRQLGITAIDLVASEARVIAEIFAAAAAKFAHPTGPAEPRHANPIADSKAVNLGAFFSDCTDDLVAENERQFRVRQFAIDNVQIGPTHRTGAHRDQQLLRPRPRRRHLRRYQRPLWFGQQLCAHLHPRRRICYSTLYRTVSLYVPVSTSRHCACRRLACFHDRRLPSGAGRRHGRSLRPDHDPGLSRG